MNDFNGSFFYAVLMLVAGFGIPAMAAWVQNYKGQHWLQVLRAEVAYRKSLKYTAEKDGANVLYNLGNSLFDQEKMLRQSNDIQKYQDKKRSLVQLMKT